jgi:ribonucleotide monophosphatase NagD (HAD superfamily)
MNPQALLLDLDGVLYVEDEPVPGAREAVADAAMVGDSIADVPAPLDG